MDTQAEGQAGERLAREWLERNGYKCLAVNWQCRLGEIDLILRPPDIGHVPVEVRVFVEVRLRGRADFGTAAETVSSTKQRKITQAARWYQQQEDYWGDIRFDVIAIDASTEPEPTITHLEGAFEAYA